MKKYFGSLGLIKLLLIVSVILDPPLQVEICEIFVHTMVLEGACGWPGWRLQLGWGILKYII